MINEIHRRCRYDFFIIWGNGLEHAEAILDILRREEHLEIIRVESRKVRGNMRRFVFDLYKCDPVPKPHLRFKLRYLFKVRPEVIIVFVKNLAPEETFLGSGAFRHTQCAYIKRIKDRIRDMYNPRAGGVRTEEHVIHASDYEEQVDYFLKMLGRPEGIYYLYEDNKKLPFKKPYHIPHPQTYTFRTLSLDRLWAAVLVDTGSKHVRTELRKVHDTPHFQGLRTDGQVYTEYINRYRCTYLTDDYSLERFLTMNELSDYRVKSLPPILITPVAGGFEIRDGVHRAAVTLNHGIETIRCVEIAR